MRRALVMLLLVTLIGVGSAADALAGAKLHINDDAEFDLGIRIQPYYMNTQTDLDGDGEWDWVTDYRVRRARLRLKVSIGEYVEGFVQSEISGAAGGALGRPMRLIDSYVLIKAHKWARFYAGINMAPVYRQNLTSSGAMLAMERPAMTYKDLSWGNRAFGYMATAAIPGTDSGLRGEDDVRDEGITLFGAGKLGESDASIKYYLGVFDGIQTTPGEHNDRYAGRVQINFFDAEPGYYNSAMYLGKKKTVGIGAAFDMQKAVAPDDAGEPIDYKVFTADGFVEYPVGDGSFTAEAGWSQLDLGDATANLGTAADPVYRDWNAIQGSGFYAQAAYLFNEKWQPWILFEQWSSDAADDETGNYTLYRFGVSYFIEGQNANIKLGYESVKTDVPVMGDEDTQNTIVLGTYVTY